MVWSNAFILTALSHGLKFIYMLGDTLHNADNGNRRQQTPYSPEPYQTEPFSSLTEGEILPHRILPYTVPGRSVVVWSIMIRWEEVNLRPFHTVISCERC